MARRMCGIGGEQLFCRATRVNGPRGRSLPIRSDIFEIDGGTSKFDYRSGGREAWLQKVDRIRLRDITPDKIQKWKVEFLRRAGSNPAKRRSATISVNSLLRQAKSLFAPDVLKFVKVDIAAS